VESKEEFAEIQEEDEDSDSSSSSVDSSLSELKP
jgi:hypothetical protein